MPNYRLVFTEQDGEMPVRSISFAGDDAREALRLAQYHDGPAQLWLEGKQLCTLVRTGSEHELWVILGAHSLTTERQRSGKSDSVRALPLPSKLPRDRRELQDKITFGGLPV